MAGASLVFIANERGDITGVSTLDSSSMTEQEYDELIEAAETAKVQSRLLDDGERYDIEPVFAYYDLVLKHAYTHLPDWFAVKN
jgi:hypothetical protein